MIVSRDVISKFFVFDWQQPTQEFDRRPVHLSLNTFSRFGAACALPNADVSPLHTLAPRS